MLYLLFWVFVIIIAMAYLMDIGSGGRTNSALGMFSGYKQARRDITEGMLNKKIGTLQNIAAQGYQLKDQSAQGIYNYDNNSGIKWGDLSKQEQAPYHQLSNILNNREGQD